jgi:hypothetical protein
MLKICGFGTSLGSPCGVQVTRPSVVVAIAPSAALSLPEHPKPAPLAFAAWCWFSSEAAADSLAEIARTAALGTVPVGGSVVVGTCPGRRRFSSACR